jgi:hypothetical protein
MVKLYVDGLLNTRTAAIFGNYELAYPDLGVGDEGIHYMTEERMAKYMTALQVCLHCYCNVQNSNISTNLNISEHQVRLLWRPWL